MIMYSGNITIKGVALPTGTINLTSVSGSASGGWVANYTVYASPSDAKSSDNSLGDSSTSFPYVAGEDPIQQAGAALAAAFSTLALVP